MGTLTPELLNALKKTKFNLAGNCIYADQATLEIFHANNPRSFWRILDTQRTDCSVVARDNNNQEGSSDSF